MILPDLPKTKTLSEKQELRRLLRDALDCLEKEIDVELQAGPPPLNFLPDSVIRCGASVAHFAPRYYTVIEFVWNCPGHKATKEEIKELAWFDDSLDNTYITKEIRKARKLMDENDFPWVLCNEMRFVALREKGE